MDWKKENMIAQINSAERLKERVQLPQQQGDILPMTQMESYARNAQQRYWKMSLFFQHDSQEDQEKALDTADSVLQDGRAIPSSLPELCFQMQQRIKKFALLPTSQEDQEALEAVMVSELGMIWQDLRSPKPDATLTLSENRVLLRETFAEVLGLCEELYLSYLHLQHSLRRRAVFTDSANRSRLAAQMASDCTSVLNVHSIRRGLSTGIKAERKARTSADTQKAGAVHQGQATDTSTTPDRMMLSLHKGKHKQHKVSIQKDIAEINEKIGEFNLEYVYDLMPYRLDTIRDFHRNQDEKKGPDEDLPTVPTEGEVSAVFDGFFTRLKGCTSMPDLSRETLLDELEIEAPPPRPRSPMVLLALRRPVVQKQTLSPADDLKRLLQDDSSLETVDPDVDIPPLIKARSYKSSVKLQKLQAVLQRLTDKRECLAKSRAPLKGPEYPQADVVSVPISCQATARMAAPRVSDRVQTEKIHISVFPPVYNDIKREIDGSSVKWMDRNLFDGDEIKELCKTLSKCLMSQYLSFQDDPLIEPCVTQPKLSTRKMTPNSLMNAALKNSISSRKRAEAPMDHKKPLDVTSRAYAAWFQWWRSHLSLDDYLKHITSQELDYLAVVFQLHATEVKKDSEEDKIKALQQQKDEKKRARTKKMEALKRMKQEYVTGVWNVNTVLFGGLWNEPVLQEDDSPGKKEAPEGKERNALFRDPSEVTEPANAEQLKERLERLWTVLCLPDALRLDMAIKYSSHAYRDQLEKAVIAWEQAAHLIQLRETVLSKLELFEWEASDPHRFFHQGYRGTAVARMEESKQREALDSQISSLEKELTKILSVLSDCFRDTVTYKGRPYREKMRWDRVEMLYWLQQERRVQSLERVVTKKDVLPARLPPLELAQQQYRVAQPTPRGCIPKDEVLLYGDKPKPALSVSHIQLCLQSKLE